jgi:hypothetical protein
MAQAAHDPAGRQPWIPSIGQSWQIVLNAPIKINPSNPEITPDVDIYTIDLFDNSAATVAALHKLGKKVIAYFSAGTYEEWRPDAKKFDKADLGKPMDDWPGERWLNLKSEGVREIMRERIRLAADKGFDAVDPDNVDGYVSTSLTLLLQLITVLTRCRATRMAWASRKPTQSPS